MKKTVICLFALLFFNHQSKSQKLNIEPSGAQFIQEDFNRVLSPKEIKDDVNYFFDKLKEVHVNPYAFVGKDSVNQRKKELIKTCSKPLKVYEFNREFSRINGLFDGHTMIYFDWKYMYNYIDRSGRLLPLETKIEENKIYIKSDNDSLNNLEIITINGINAYTIITEMKRTMSPENEGKRNLFVESNFKELLIAVFDMKAPYILLVKDISSDTTQTLILDGSPAFMLPGKKRLSHPDYSLREYIEDSIAIIEYNTSVVIDGAKWKHDIDSMFNLVKTHKIKYLFLDISRNGGGSSSTNELFFKNINHKPNPFEVRFVRKVSLESKLHLLGLSLAASDESYEKRLQKYDSLIKSDHLTEDERRFIELKKGIFDRHEFYYCCNIIDNGFDGELIVIQSYKTYSAALDMAAIFKYCKIGTIIGCETGGTTELFCEGLPFILPNSLMKFRVADNYYKYPGGNLYTGIMPDIDLGYGFYKEKYELEDLKNFLKKIITDR